MHKRVYTAIVFTVVLIAAVLLQGWAERIVLLACMLTGVWEMCGAMQAKGLKPNRPVACAYCCLTVVMQGLSASGVHPFDRMDAPLTAMVFGVMLGFSVVVFSGKPDFERALATCFPMLYPGLPFGLMITLMDRSCAFVSALAMALALFTASITALALAGSRFRKAPVSVC
ncbi:MAG: hypothetical protein E7317_06445, partial [Clostridiales bacterium]|nr:hypothetical protein [Clostridiales bacterium]